jgi:hypothetical protein
MTDKAVQKLSKRELLEILVSQGKQIEKLQADLKLVKEQLDDKELSIDNAGSIAEASLMVNNIFTDAEAACQQYLDNIMSLEQRQQEATKRIEQKEAEVDRLLQQTRSRTGSRTMPSWTKSRTGIQRQEQPVEPEEIEDEYEEPEAPAPVKTQAKAATRTTTQRAAQPQTRATVTTASRAVAAAPRAAAVVAHPNTVSRSAQNVQSVRSSAGSSAVRQTATAATGSRIRRIG